MIILIFITRLMRDIAQKLHFYQSLYLDFKLKPSERVCWHGHILHPAKVNHHSNKNRPEDYKDYDDEKAQCQYQHKEEEDC